jgi:hypothetical protein
MVYCTNCGNKLGSSDSFCTSCGTTTLSIANNQNGRIESDNILSKQKAKLIECNYCNKPIAITANKCTSCGAPNSWVHPDIQEFLNLKIESECTEQYDHQWMNITYSVNKSEIRGVARKQPKKIAFELGAAWIFCLFYGWASDGVIPIGRIATIIVCILGAMHLLGLFHNRYYWFEANLDTKTWKSNSDYFWTKYKKALNF